MFYKLTLIIKFYVNSKHTRIHFIQKYFKTECIYFYEISPIRLSAYYWVATQIKKLINLFSL